MTLGIASLSRKISLVLAASLIFLVPFDPGRNIDLQGMLLIVSGGFAWIAILASQRQLLHGFDRLSGTLLGIFISCCLLSCLVNPNAGYDFFGAPYIRLGLAGFIACVGIGLLAMSIARRQLSAGLYRLIMGLALTAIPYSWFHNHSLLRISGIVNQADIFACLLGCGLILGLELFELYPKRRRPLAAGQAFLVILLILTQTRAVLFLVIVLWLAWMFQHRTARSWKRAGLYLAAGVLLFGVLHYAAPGRLTNAGYASQSLHYRLTLQRYALQASRQKPVLGYGPGNLADPLSCERLVSLSMQKTCDEGYFFNSSHNIFIDRALAFGWLGGLAFLGMVLLAAWRGLHTKSASRAFAYAVVLIGCYYLTNVSSAALELLLWVLLMQCLLAEPNIKRQP